MAEIKNLTSLLRKLEKYERVSQQQNNGNVIVGYAASYAMYVHENVAMKWKGLPRGAGLTVSKTGVVLVPKSILQSGQVGGTGKGFYWDPQGKAQAKFLEQPFREKQREIATIVVNAMKRGSTLIKALLLGGLFLQRESQKLVPVDTGNLRASAFTEKE